jgi:hypothetical protein
MYCTSMPLFRHTKLAKYLHKYNFVNGEESVINFTPCKCSSVPEYTDIIEKNHRLFITRILFCTLSISLSISVTLNTSEFRFCCCHVASYILNLLCSVHYIKEIHIPGNRYLLHLTGQTEYVHAQTGRLCDKPHYETFPRIT